MRFFLFAVLLSLFSSPTFAIEGATNSCDDDLIQSYLSTRQCAIESNATACLLLALPNPTVSGAAAGSALGALAQRGLNSVLKSAQKDAFLRKWSEARETIFKERIKLNKIKNGYLGMQDAEAKAITNGRHESLKSILNEVAQLSDDLKKTPAANKSKTEKLTKALERVNWELERVVHNAREKALAGSSKAKIKEDGLILRGFISDPNAEIKTKLTNITEMVAEQFPDEAKILNPYIEEAHKGLLSDAQKTEQLAEFEALANKSPRLRMVAALFMIGGHNALIEMNGNSLAGKPNHQLKLIQKKVRGATGFISRNGMRIARTGLVGAIAGGAAGYFINRSNQNDIKDCQTDLGMSSFEVDFLQGASALSSAKASSGEVIGNICSSLFLSEPENSIDQALEKFGFVPPGMCKMIKNEMKRMDQLVGSIENDLPTVTCLGVKSNGILIASNNKSRSFEYSDGVRTVRAPLKEDGNPDFRFVKFTAVKNVDGKISERPLPSEELDFQSRYNNLHPASTPDTSPELADYATSCTDRGSVLPCEIIRASIRAKTLNAVQKEACQAGESRMPIIDEIKKASPGTI